jgi:hypothetical protein
MEEISDHTSGLLYGQMLRAYFWLRTIAKLNEPGDFQAVAAGSRALFETAIDMVLLHANPDESAKVLAWEESARFKNAAAIEVYYRTLAVPPAPEHEGLVCFAKADKVRINQLRLQQGWQDKNGHPFHPERWTGRKLDADARQADQCGHEFKFSHFYETTYRQVCWLVHGSAFVFRRVPAEDVPSIGGLLYEPACDLATLCAELTVRRVLGWNADHEREFVALRKRRILAAGITRRLAMGEPPLPTIPGR